MGESYDIRRLRLSIEQSRAELEAERAELKSEVSMELQTPELEVISESKWDSDLGRNVIERENSRHWQANLSVRQPAILFGWPTNGYLSLNNVLYRGREVEPGSDDVAIRYYNRYFIQYEQPLFQPNELQNSLQEARLNLEEQELNFHQDVVEIYTDLASDYFELYERAYAQKIYRSLLAGLEDALRIAENRATRDTSAAVEISPIRVELTNAQEQLNSEQSEFRIRTAELKQQLRLREQDSIYVDPSLEITPVSVSEEQALDLGMNLRPSLRELQIDRQQSAIELDNTKGEDSFQASLELSYGLENNTRYFDRLWGKPANSYTASVNVEIPIWDWGAHDKRVQAQQVEFQQAKLEIDETREEIRSDITQAIRNLKEFQERTLSMEENLDIARQNTTQRLQQFRQQEISTLELLQTLQRQRQTAENFLDAYLGYREARVSLQALTFYDFRRNQPLIDRFKVSVDPEE